jgi:hypothetical protein
VSLTSKVWQPPSGAIAGVAAEASRQRAEQSGLGAGAAQTQATNREASQSTGATVGLMSGCWCVADASLSSVAVKENRVSGFLLAFPGASLTLGTRGNRALRSFSAGEEEQPATGRDADKDAENTGKGGIR